MSLRLRPTGVMENRRFLALSVEASDVGRRVVFPAEGRKVCGELLRY